MHCCYFRASSRNKHPIYFLINCSLLQWGVGTTSLSLSLAQGKGEGQREKNIPSSFAPSTLLFSLLCLSSSSALQKLCLLSGIPWSGFSIISRTMSKRLDDARKCIEQGKRCRKFYSHGFYQYVCKDMNRC